MLQTYSFLVKHAFKALVSTLVVNYMFIRGKTYITAPICDFNFRYKHEGVMLNCSVD